LDDSEEIDSEEDNEKKFQKDLKQFKSKKI